MLVVNLYPFEATVAKPGCTLADAIENIDIGGPAMVRSAAKNWKDVAVLTDASQYEAVMSNSRPGKLSDKLRFALSVAAFNRISNYDAAISDYLSSVTFERGVPRRRRCAPAPDLFPGQSNGRSSSCRTCATARTRTSRPPVPRPVPGARLAGHRRAAAGQGAVLQQHRRRRRGLGMRQELRRAGLRDRQARQPLRRGRGQGRAGGLRKAFQTDPTSAFGGIIAFNRTLDGERPRPWSSSSSRC
jgi:phosphoribosylaminoimidazolecarboxamide formyltransferase / IMP cyclohydrolase